MQTRPTLAAAALLATNALLGCLANPAIAHEKGPVPGAITAPSPGWTRAMPPGADARVKITEAYANLVARDA
jgi:hypothetical protein